MAAERLGEILDGLMADMPLGDPDYIYLRGVKARNAFYVASARRRLQMVELEKKNLIAKDREERSRFIENVPVVVSGIFGKPIEDILKGGRAKDLVLARIVTSYLFVTVGGLSLTEIGRIMGGRHHTTIMHHLTRADSLMARDVEFAESILEAENRLRQLVAPGAPSTPQLTNGSTNGITK